MGLLDVPRLHRVCGKRRELPRTAANVMSHGDLIPGNVLVTGERLSGVLDTGGLGPAGPAPDLTSAWHLLQPGPREVLRRAPACDDLEWERGNAGAFAQATGLVRYYVESDPTMSRMGRRTLDRIAAPSPCHDNEGPGRPWAGDVADAGMDVFPVRIIEGL